MALHGRVLGIFDTVLTARIDDRATEITVADTPPSTLVLPWVAVLSEREIIVATAIGGAGDKTLAIMRGSRPYQHMSGAMLAHVVAFEPEPSPAGPEGPAGPTGRIGACGDQGPAGAKGEPGPRGDEGPEGPPGRDAQMLGPAGPQGTQGPRGRQGDPGPAATGILWHGDHDDTTVYAQGDGVRGHDGNLYISTVAENEGNDPVTNQARQWMALSALGAAR